MNLVAELHRRHVFRVAAAYGVAAWLLIQVADIVMPRLGLPDWTVTFVIVVLALGFPLALMFSWGFDRTPEGIRRARRGADARTLEIPFGRRIDFLIIAALAVALALLVARQWAWLGGPAPNAAAPTETEAMRDVPSILVLPFRSISDQSDNRYFAEGLSEEIMNALVRLPQLRVVGPATAFAYRERSKDLRQIGAELSVDYILDGSVRRQAEAVRIAVQLSESKSGFNLWSNTFDERMVDIFAVQKQISRTVIEKLKIELLPEESRRLGQVSTTSVEAYDLYLKGLSELRRAAGADDFDRAFGHFEAALALDPTFADAEAGKCQALNGKYRITLTSRLIEEAIEECNRAVAMNAKSPRVQIALGNLYIETGRHELALEAFARAVEMAPLLDEAHRGLGDALTAQGRLGEARVAFGKALELAPNRAQNHASFAIMLYLGNQLADAAGQFRAAAELEPDNPRHRSNLVAALFRMGRFEQAAEEALRSIDIEPTSQAYSNAGTQFFYAGDYTRAVELFRAAVELAPDDARLHGNLGEACRMSPACEHWRDDYRTAIELVDERLAVNPDDAVARALRGLYNAHLGKRDAATDDLDAAIAASPSNPDVLWAAAAAAGLAGNASDAAEYARRAHAAGYPLEALRADPFIQFQGDIRTPKAQEETP